MLVSHNPKTGQGGRQKRFAPLRFCVSSLHRDHARSPLCKDDMVISPHKHPCTRSCLLCARMSSPLCCECPPCARMPSPLQGGGFDLKTYLVPFDRNHGTGFGVLCIVRQKPSMTCLSFSKKENSSRLRTAIIPRDRRWWNTNKHFIEVRRW